MLCETMLPTIRNLYAYGLTGESEGFSGRLFRAGGHMVNGPIEEWIIPPHGEPITFAQLQLDIYRYVFANEYADMLTPAETLAFLYSVEITFASVSAWNNILAHR